MQLTELLKDIVLINAELDREVTGLTQDSRQVQAGYLFFAYPGTQLDGRQFVKDAIAAGATAILMEDENKEVVNVDEIVIIKLPQLTHYLGLIASRFYNIPSQQLTIVGVTGTNGKTSCSQMIAQCLQQAGHKCAVIGTIGNGFIGHLQAGSLTTPDAVELHKLLAEFKQQGASHVSMEISSHRLAQGRISGLDLDIALFTNLTRDHLDYHGDMTHYAAAKRSLFDQPNLHYAVLNADDQYGREWLLQLHHRLPTFAYSLVPPKAELSHIPHCYVHRTHFHQLGMTASVSSPWGDGVLHNPYLVGRFNLSNLLGVLTCLCLLEIPFAEALNFIAQLRGVSGRMETFNEVNKPLVVVDYSHTPDALEQALRALREHCEGKLWCVFGCGGNRDRGKRPLMGAVAERYADELVLTNDNPRHENPQDIVNDIVQGLTNPAKAVIEYDRRRAITHAIRCAQAGDTILIAGKGHEHYQIIGNEKQPFSDSIEVRLLLND